MWRHGHYVNDAATVVETWLRSSVNLAPNHQLSLETFTRLRVCHAKERLLLKECAAIVLCPG